MYHRETISRAKKLINSGLVPLLLFLTIPFSPTSSAFEKTAAETESSLAVAVPTANCQPEVVIGATKEYPLPPNKKSLKRAPKTVELYQHDKVPLGSRKPLLMVHGLRGEFQQGFRWNKVADYFSKDPQFNKNFKIYYARYNTYTELATVKPHFKAAVKELCQSTGAKQIEVMALSLGGCLVQDSMEDPEVHQMVRQVFTLGTPFHGSPLFCFDWFRYSIIKTHSMPWVQGDLCLSYKLYFSRHPNLLADLRWDNSDLAVPQVGRFSTWFPFHIAGDVTVEGMSNPRLFNINERLKLDKQKFICYGGYLLTPYVTPHRSNRFWKTVRWPWWFATCTVPYHLGFEHPVLRALNYEMGRMVVAGNGPKQAIQMGSARYGLNDGITPLVSALFLPSSELAKIPISGEQDLSHIRRATDVRKARAFREIDHITFIDGYRPRGYSKELRDELAPAEPERNIFEWMLTDLLGDERTLAAEQDKLQAIP